MASFILTLDTTGPILSIYAPSYVVNNTEMQFIIEASEEISSYQNIYMIDSLGTRYDYIFSATSTYSLRGDIVLTNVSLGLSSLYVEVEDVVGNRTTSSKHFNVIQNNNIKITEEIDSVKIIHEVDYIKTFKRESSLLILAEEHEGKSTYREYSIDIEAEEIKIG